METLYFKAIITSHEKGTKAILLQLFDSSYNMCRSIPLPTYFWALFIDIDIDIDIKFIEETPIGIIPHLLWKWIHSWENYKRPYVKDPSQVNSHCSAKVKSIVYGEWIHRTNKKHAIYCCNNNSKYGLSCLVCCNHFSHSQGGALMETLVDCKWWYFLHWRMILRKISKSAIPQRHVPLLTWFLFFLSGKYDSSVTNAIVDLN